ncbi:unnamed protein product [Strongylus vulgaris]|uniref:C2H2-type domain-containing protein n=1 Tax=Strongylus vulgaris TaxID=40348 RepID=A0A3P7IVX7_STRVU|nr:unnamed protein product [Strongylus vulgaris]
MPKSKLHKDTAHVGQPFPESSSSSEYKARVPGLMFISLQFGATRYAVVLCTKEEGFEKGSYIEVPKSWKNLIREDCSNANVEGNLVVRDIRWGDEIVLKSIVTSTAVTEVEKREPVDLSLDTKFCADATGFSCDRCGKVFSYSYYRDKHLKYTRCVDNGDRKYPCPICPRSFEKRDRLRIHILHVHENHRPHLCTVCGKAFSQSSSLNKFNYSWWKFVAKANSSIFLDLGLIPRSKRWQFVLQHLRVHSGERPYKCSFCPKAFTASSILRTHIRQHSGEKPFKCAFCGKPFASHAAHDSHVRRTHGVNKE